MLKAALGNIHRDRGWWHKVLIGGALYLSVLGWPLAEGFHLESIENTQRGFPSPLPRWGEWGTKAITGVFGWVIDVFFFVLPLLLAGAVLLCGVLSLGLFGNTFAGQVVGTTIVGLALAYILLVWLSSAGITSKLYYAREGDITLTLRSEWVRSGFRTAERAVYGPARLRSLPFYLGAGVLLWGAIGLIDSGGWVRLLGLWLGLSALFYARLVTIQLYTAAARELERRQFSL